MGLMQRLLVRTASELHQLWLRSQWAHQVYNHVINSVNGIADAMRSLRKNRRASGIERFGGIVASFTRNENRSLRAARNEHTNETETQTARYREQNAA